MKFGSFLEAVRLFFPPKIDPRGKDSHAIGGVWIVKFYLSIHIQCVSPQAARQIPTKLAPRLH